MNIKRIHHVAYRCNNAKETVEFYQRVMGMDFQLAIAEDTERGCAIEPGLRETGITVAAE